MELTVFLQNAEELNRSSFRTKRNGRSCEGLAATSVITVLFSDSPRALTHDKTRFNLNITFRLTAFTGVFFPSMASISIFCRQFPPYPSSGCRPSSASDMCVRKEWYCHVLPLIYRPVCEDPCPVWHSWLRRPRYHWNANTAVGGSSSSSRRIIAS